MDNHFNVNTDVMSVPDIRRTVLDLFDGMCYRNQRLVLAFVQGLSDARQDTGEAGVETDSYKSRLASWLFAAGEQLEKAMGIITISIGSLNDDNLSTSDALAAALDIIMDVYSGTKAAREKLDTAK